MATMRRGTAGGSPWPAGSIESSNGSADGHPGAAQERAARHGGTGNGKAKVHMNAL